jgi:hypothetical protein
LQSLAKQKKCKKMQTPVKACAFSFAAVHLFRSSLLCHFIFRRSVACGRWCCALNVCVFDENTLILFLLWTLYVSCSSNYIGGRTRLCIGYVSNVCNREDLLFPSHVDTHISYWYVRSTKNMNIFFFCA